MSHKDQVNALIQDALIPIKEGIARRDAIQTKVVYYRTAVVKRFVDESNPRDGGWAGGVERQFEVTESTNTPNEMLACERKLIRITKVTTTTEVVG